MRQVQKLSLPKRIVEQTLSRYPFLLRAPMILAGKERMTVCPETVRIENTNICNAKCTYCPRDEMKRSQGFMEFSLFKKIVDDCVEIGVKNLHLHNYGEPLLDKQLPERIAYAKSKNPSFRTTIISNASFLNEEVSRKLIEAGLDELIVSLDPGEAEENDKVRLRLSQTQIEENLRRFSEIRREVGAKNPDLVLAATVHDQNRWDLAAFLERWTPIVQHIHVQELHNWGGSYPLKSVSATKPCSRLWLTFTVLWDGRVALCCVDSAGKHVLGDMRNETVMEVWNNREYRKFRSLNLRGYKKEDVLCRTCTLPQRDSPLWLKRVLLSSPD